MITVSNVLWAINKLTIIKKKHKTLGTLLKTSIKQSVDRLCLPSLVLLDCTNI